MSAQQDAVALDWIKGEIGETLSQAQQALDLVAESPDDGSSMRSCLTALHQVHGTLKMVELPGAVQLAAEMEELAQALMNNSVPDVKQAQEVLMQNILQLPGYLGRVQRQHGESPEFVAATVDDLRVARGEPALNSPAGAGGLVSNLELINTLPDADATENYVNSGGAKVIRKLRIRYQQSLVELLKEENKRENLGVLAKIFNMLSKATRVSPVSHLSTLVIALIEGIANGSIELDGRISNALKQIDPIFKNLIELGEEGLQTPIPEELLNVLLQTITSDAKETNRVLAIKQTYLKESVVPESAGVDRMLGPDDETMSVVAKVLLEELIILKDKLDLYVRASPRNRADIEALIPGLEKFDSSMTVIGMSENQQVLQGQADLLRTALAEGDEPPESLLLGIASAFIQVETVLSPLVVRDVGEVETDVVGDLSEAEVSVIKEVRNGLGQCRDAVIEYISSEFDMDKIVGLPGQLMDLRGGLLVINQTRSANALLACAEYVSKGILATSATPELEAMDDLADCITSVDYYFERYLDNSAEPYLQMLEVAEAGVARLGYSVQDSVEAFEQGLAGTGQEAGAEPASAEPDASEVDAAESEEPESADQQAARETDVDGLELEEALEESEMEIESVDMEVESQGETSLEEQIAEGEFEVDEVDMSVPDALPEQAEAPEADVGSSDDAAVEKALNDAGIEVEQVAGTEGRVDDEIIEIFVEESAEVLQTIEEFYPAWKNNRGNLEALTEIRRAFHTLKGSGRMVGAVVVGELAWAIEDLLNHVLDKSVVANAELITLMDEVIERIPALVKAFESKDQDSVDVSDLESKANRLANVDSPSSDAAVVVEEEGESLDQDAGGAELEPESIQEAEEATSAEAFELDPELVEIFVGEAADLMQVYGEFIARAEKGPVSFTPELRAALHTLKGSSSMAEIKNIVPIAVQLDAMTSQMFDQSIKTDEQTTALLKRGHELISKAVEGLDSLVAVPVAGADAFLAELEDFAKASGGAGEAETKPKESRPVFTFDGVQMLLESEEILDEWRTDGLRSMVSELDLLIERSEKTGKVELNLLLTCLRSAYGPLSISHPPAEVALAGLRRGHNHLIDVLDMVAAGQKEEVDPSIVKILEQLSESGDTDLVSAEPIQFVQEAWICLNNMDAALRQWKEDIHNSLELERIYDYVNTLSRQAQDADEMVIVELCDRILQCCGGLKNGDLTPIDSDVGLLESCHKQLVSYLGAVQQTEDRLPNESLIQELDTRVETTPTDATAPAESDADVSPAAVDDQVEVEEEEIDEEILSIFLEEADELVESIDQSILQWNGQRDDAIPLNNLLRFLHTLKGGARLAGLSSLGEFAHNFETDLISVQQGKVPIDDGLFSNLNRGQDEISRRIEIYRKIVAGEATAEERASATRTPSAEAAEEAPAEPVPAKTAPAASIAKAEKPVEAAAPAAAKPEVEDSKPTRSTQQQQEVVRVSAELLDDLVGMAGESSIARGLVEEQINEFSDNIDELALTINRIRDQIRRLEIETEMRETVFRSSESAKSSSEFDELEMDQYTELQEISRSLAEGVSDLMEHKDTLKTRSRDAEVLLQQQSRLSNEIQEGLTRTKMVPFSRMIPRLRRIVRQISDELGKKIRFDAFNVDGELDRNVLERVVAPLEHMLRNAVDHGIESAEARKKLGKAEEGRISLRLSQEAGHFVIVVSDDGGGIDAQKVRRKAIDQGLLEEDAQVSNQEVLSFIMRAGFSTAEKLTQISGRGVGMDVVDSELKQLGGAVTIDSTPGKGTEFTIRIPFTVSITRALMVNVGDRVYAIPLNSIEGIVRVSPYELEAYYQPEAPRFEYANQAYKLVYMGRVLEKSVNPNLEGQIALLPVLLARSGESAVAFQVDRVIGSREVVVKSIGPQFNEVTGISGASILGDGSVVVILDLMALLRYSYQADTEAEFVEQQPIEEAERVRTVMIVDDSITVRKVTSRLIERQGWDVMLAKDGIDAMDQLQEALPDIMLLDIEMPRMDGFEVLRTVRHDDRIQDLPIVMITSRTGEKHRKQAVELGVNRYLGKPFQEEALISTIEEVLVERRG